MVGYLDRAKMTTATTGTGTLTLGSAVSGFQSFAAAGATNSSYLRYVIEDGTDWEIGRGFYTMSGTTLSRTLLSSSTGSLLSLSGNAIVYSAVAADDLGANTPTTGDMLIAGSVAESPSWGGAEYWAALNSSYTLTSTTAAQKLFNSSTNGALTLPVGLYRYEAQISVASMSATSGNASFSLGGAGTATIASQQSLVVGVDNTTGTTNTASASYWTAATSITSMVFAATSTAMCALITGTFRISAAGTIIPSIGLVTAAAAIVQPNTFFRAKRISRTSTDVVSGGGAWS